MEEGREGRQGAAKVLKEIICSNHICNEIWVLLALRVMCNNETRLMTRLLNNARA